MPKALTQPKKTVGGAFGCFTKEKRQEFTEALAGKPATAVLKMASEAWNKLSDAQKAPYEKMLDKAKAKFEKDMAAFLAAGGVKTKGEAGLRRERRLAKQGVKPKNKMKDANAPKKPCGGAFGVYLAENREAIFKSVPAGRGAVASAAGTQWNALSDAAKKPFQKKFLKYMEEYKVAFEKYKKTDAFEEHRVALEEYKKTLHEDAGKDDDEEDEEAEEQDEVLAGASPQKRRRLDTGAVMDEAKKEGLQLKLKSMMENPKIACKDAQVVLKALRKAGGKVAEAKRQLA